MNEGGHRDGGMIRGVARPLRYWRGRNAKVVEMHGGADRRATGGPASGSRRRQYHLVAAELGFIAFDEGLTPTHFGPSNKSSVTCVWVEIVRFSRSRVPGSRYPISRTRRS